MIRNLNVNYSTDGKWEVKFEGDPHPINIARTQEQAVTYARKMAENEKCSVIVHDEKGKTQNRLCTYCPCPRCMEVYQGPFILFQQV